jgi:hypothetical protein
MTQQTDVTVFKLGDFVQPPCRAGKGQPIGRINTIVTTERLDGITERKFGVRFFEVTSLYHAEHVTHFFGGELLALTAEQVAEYTKK